jgi:hypothetical protein
MAYGVNTTVNAVQPSPLYPPVDRVLTQPEVDELSVSYHAVLPPREVGDRPIDEVLRDLAVHYAAK